MDVTPSEFNHALLQSKRRALSALDELIATPAAPQRKPQPTTREDGTYLTYEERNILNACRPPHPTIDELDLLVKDRLARMRAAVAVLKTRPVDSRGNPLPLRPAARGLNGDDDGLSTPGRQSSDLNGAAESGRAGRDGTDSQPDEADPADALPAGARARQTETSRAGPLSSAGAGSEPPRSAAALSPGLPRAYARAP